MIWDDGTQVTAFEMNYDIVAEALLWTLEQGLGPKFTPQVRDAWTTTYTVLARTMHHGAAANAKAAA